MDYKLSTDQLRELAESAYAAAFDAVVAAEKLAASTRWETEDIRHMTDEASRCAAELSSRLAVICEAAKKQS